MARHGARVMHPRAVELGDVYGMPVVVRSSFSAEPGTLISRGDDMALEARQRVRGIAHDVDVGRVTIAAVPDRPGIAYAVFDALAQAAINVDIIVQDVDREKESNLSFTVGRDDLEKAVAVVRPVAAEVGAQDVHASADLAKISIVGSGLSTRAGVCRSHVRGAGRGRCQHHQYHDQRNPHYLSDSRGRRSSRCAFLTRRLRLGRGVTDGRGKLSMATSCPGALQSQGSRD